MPVKLRSPPHSRSGCAVGEVVLASSLQALAAIEAPERVAVLGRFDLTPPPFVVLLLVTLLVCVYFGLSRIGATLAAVPLAWLVGLQAFRFPLELVMHRAAVEGVMPEQMSYTGWNFDILTGITALLLAPAIAFGRCLLYTSPSPRDRTRSRMPPSA